MVKWFEQANRYYSEFSGLFVHVSPMNWRVIGTLISCVLFIGYFGLVSLNLTSIPTLTKLIGLVLTEVSFLAFYRALTNYKNKSTVEAFML